MTRSEFSPACASAGANKSSRVRHQSTLPRARAAIPAAKSTAAAPSITPLPPPAISCNAPSGSAPPGSRESTAVTPKGNDGVARRCWPSICRTWARRDSMADGGHTGRVDLSGRMRHVLYLFLAARFKSVCQGPDGRKPQIEGPPGSKLNSLADPPLSGERLALPRRLPSGCGSSPCSALRPSHSPNWPRAAEARRAVRVALLELELAGTRRIFGRPHRLVRERQRNMSRIDSQSNELFSWCNLTAGSSDSSSAGSASGTPQVRTNASLSAFAIPRK